MKLLQKAVLIAVLPIMTISLQAAQKDDADQKKSAAQRIDCAAVADLFSELLIAQRQTHKQLDTLIQLVRAQNKILLRSPQPTIIMPSFPLPHPNQHVQMAPQHYPQPIPAPAHPQAPFQAHQQGLIKSDPRQAQQANHHGNGHQMAHQAPQPLPSRFQPIGSRVHVQQPQPPSAQPDAMAQSSAFNVPHERPHQQQRAFDFGTEWRSNKTLPRYIRQQLESTGRWAIIDPDHPEEQLRTRHLPAQHLQQHPGAASSQPRTGP